MQTVVANPLEMLLLLLLGGGFGSGIPGEEDPLIAKTAPADCLVYFSWADAGEAKADSENHTEQLLTEPAIQQFLKKGRGTLLPPIEQPRGANAPQPAMVGDMRKLVELVQGKAGAFFISDVQVAGNGPPRILGGGLLRADQDAHALEGLLEDFQSRVPKENISSVKIGKRTFSRVLIDEMALPVTWGIVGKYLVVGVGDGSAEEIMKRARGTTPEWLNGIRAKLAVPRTSSILHVDIKKVIQTVVTVTGNDELNDMLSALGLDGIQDFSMISGLDDTGCTTRALLAVEGEGRGVLSWIDSEPLRSDDLKIIDHDAPVALLFKLNPSAAFDLFLQVMGQFDPDAPEEISEELADVEQQFGVKLREDVLNSLGDTWRIFAPPGLVGPINGWTAAIQVRDQQRMEQVLEKLLAIANASLARGGERGPSIQSSTIKGHTAHTFTLTGAPVAPSWCLTDGELLVSVTPGGLRLALGGGQGESLASLDDVKPLIGDGSRTLAMAYVDTKTLVKTVLPIAKMGLQGLAAAQRGGPSLDISKLPPADAFLRHLQPAVIALQRTEDGVEITGRQTMPGGNITASAPMLAAMLLPGVQSARTSARRMVSMSNLKQLALSLHVYSDAHSVFPASYNADGNGKPLLSWRVHVLPYLEQKDLYEQFHLDEPWDSEHNKKLIMKMPELFRSASSNAKPGMTNYLGVAGKDGIFVNPKPGKAGGATMKQVADGLSNTIMLVEVNDDAAVIWTKPGDFTPDKDNPIKGLLGIRPSGFLAGFGDGSVQLIANTVDVDVVKAMFTKSGGEAFARNDLFQGL